MIIREMTEQESTAVVSSGPWEAGLLAGWPAIYRTIPLCLRRQPPLQFLYARSKSRVDALEPKSLCADRRSVVRSQLEKRRYTR